MRWRERFKTPLLDPSWEQMVERDPVLAYSHYLAGRIHSLHLVAEEIVENLDLGFTKGLVQGGLVARADTLMWLWLLGAYEVVRTMCESKQCFSDRVRSELLQLKRELAAVRMPAAKMELHGKPVAVSSDRSASGWCAERRDLLVNAPAASDVYARDLLAKFEAVFVSMESADVLGRHEDCYKNVV